MSANLVAREGGWAIGDWDEGDAVTNATFAPLETYEARLDEVLALARTLGFAVVDLWTAHLNPGWATDEHLVTARRLLERHGLRVASLAGGFGASPDELDRACRVATAVGAPLLGGMLDADVREPWVGATLSRHGLRLGLENHPGERTPADILARLGDEAGGLQPRSLATPSSRARRLGRPARPNHARHAPGVGTGAAWRPVGTTVDTGWWGTHGVDAVEAIRATRQHIVHVHLKDVRRAGAHETCPWGEGVVPVEACVRELRASGYDGAISIEHEPYRGDPTEAVGRMRVQLEEWLA